MKLNFLLASLALIVLLTTIGCGTAPRPTPAPTLAPVVVTVVITATPPSVTDTPSTIAPTGTLTTTAAITGTPTTLAQAKPTNTTAARGAATATRRPATATPTKVGTVAPTGIPSIAKYSQPVTLVRPVYEGDSPGDKRDEAHYGDALVFEWLSNQALGTGECYLVRVDMRSRADNSPGGDSFLQCDSQQIQQGPAQTVRFTLNKPNFTPGPTYAGIIPSGGGDINVTWSVTIVRDDGSSSSGAYFAVDGSRHNITLLSPRSKVYYFPLKGAP